MNEKRYRRELFAKVRKSTIAIVLRPIEEWHSVTQSSQEKIDSPIRLERISTLPDDFLIIGTGFFVSEHGLIATAKHVVTDAHSIEIQHRSRGGRPRRLFAMYTRPTADPLEVGEIVTPLANPRFDGNSKIDLALLETSTVPPETVRLTTLPLSSAPCEEGDRIVLAGYPLGNLLNNDWAQYWNSDFIAPAFTEATVSSLIPAPWLPPSARGMFQVAGLVNGGNSGGPAVDFETGEVVGVVIQSHFQRQYLWGPNIGAIGQRLGSKYPPAKPGALGCEPLKAAEWGTLTRPRKDGHLGVAARGT